MIEVQGSAEDLSKPGLQPVDPDADPERLVTTDWLPLGEAGRLDGHRYHRFRVFFTLPEGWTEGDPVPLVREIGVPVTTGG